MIGKLRGFIDSLQEDKCVIDVAGVGYVVFLSNKTAEFLKQFYKGNNFGNSAGNSSQNNAGKEISLIIETVVKEDAIELYGFAREIEKTWFAELTKVQGVGAKMAMKILGFFTVEDLAKALVAGDVKSFSKVSGIGPKLAQRITTELRESPKKLGIDVGFGGVVSSSENAVDFAELNGNQIAIDALSALENLGYKKADALRIIAAIIKSKKDITLENLITACLRGLSKNKF